MKKNPILASLGMGVMSAIAGPFVEKAKDFKDGLTKKGVQDYVVIGAWAATIVGILSFVYLIGKGQFDPANDLLEVVKKMIP